MPRYIPDINAAHWDDPRLDRLWDVGSLWEGASLEELRNRLNPFINKIRSVIDAKNIRMTFDFLAGGLVRLYPDSAEAADYVKGLKGPAERYAGQLRLGYDASRCESLADVASFVGGLYATIEQMQRDGVEVDLENRKTARNRTTVPIYTDNVRLARGYNDNDVLSQYCYFDELPQHSDWKDICEVCEMDYVADLCSYCTLQGCKTGEEFIQKIGDWLEYAGELEKSGVHIHWDAGRRGHFPMETNDPDLAARFGLKKKDQADEKELSSACSPSSTTSCEQGHIRQDSQMDAVKEKAMTELLRKLRDAHQRGLQTYSDECSENPVVGTFHNHYPNDADPEKVWTLKTADDDQFDSFISQDQWVGNREGYFVEEWRF